MADDPAARPDFVYFDQNVILDMAYGHLRALRERLFEKLGYRLVCSTENMEELRRVPEEHHAPALAFLRDVKAGYARMSLDMKTVSIDLSVDPAKAFAEHCETVASFSDLDYSMHGAMHKLFGGGQDQSWEDIARKQTDEILGMLDRGLHQLDDLEELPANVRDAIRQELEATKIRAADAFMEAARQMKEAEALHGARTVQEMYQVDPDAIEPPNVIAQVWEQVKGLFEPKGISLDQLLGLTPFPGVDMGSEELTLFQKVNLIYGQLSLLGYYRDGGIKKISGLKRSSSDATHAGYALCAKILVCRDKKLVKKAVAAYEYLGLHLPAVLEVKGNPRNDPGSVRWDWAWPKRP